LPANSFPRPGDNYALVDLRAMGVRYVPNGGGAGFDVVQFGVTTWGERAHPNYPAEFDIFIDVDGDNREDYVAFNGESGGFGASGQNVTTLVDVRTTPETSITRFFSSADLNSANAILNILRNDLRVSPGGAEVTPGTKLRLTFCTGDNYYTGAITDCSATVQYTLNSPRFATTQGSSFVIAPGASQNLTVTHSAGGNAASPSQLGFLLLYEHAKTGKEAEILTVVP
jgi:hypothetical protein